MTVSQISEHDFDVVNPSNVIAWFAYSRRRSERYVITRPRYPPQIVFAEIHDEPNRLVIQLADFPKSAGALRAELNGIKPNLRARGVDIDFKTSGRRGITIKLMGEKNLV